jgi:hypothetical protein
LGRKIDIGGKGVKRAMVEGRSGIRKESWRNVGKCNGKISQEERISLQISEN